MRRGEWWRLRAAEAGDPRGHRQPGGGGTGRTGGRRGGGGGGRPSRCRGLRAPHSAADWLQSDNGAGPALPRALLAGDARSPSSIGGSECLSLTGPAGPSLSGRRPARAGSPVRRLLRGRGSAGGKAVFWRPFPPGAAGPAREQRPAGENPLFKGIFS